MKKKDKHTAEHFLQRLRKAEDAGERRELLIELGYHQDEPVYSILVDYLDDSAGSVQHAAVISLGRYGNPSAIEELVKPKVLHSPVVNVRWAAVAALGKLGDYRVIDFLVKMVDDPEWVVRNQAVTELKDKIRDIIQVKDKRNARILVRLLVLDNPEILDLAIEGLYEFGEKSIELLLDALKSSSVMMRENAAKALGRMEHPSAVPTLIELLRDPEWGVRRSAVEALGLIGDQRAVEPMVQCLSDNVEMVQTQAILSITVFGNLSTAPLLNALSHEKNKFAVRAIILTLGAIRDVKSVPALISYLSSSYFIVRVAATQALIRFSSEIIEKLLPTLSYNQSDISQLLRDAANHKNKPEQLRAVKALGGLEDHRAVHLLKKLIEEKASQEVLEASEQSLIQIGCAAWGRCGALIALSEIGDKKLVPAFVHSLEDDSDNVRLEAVRALAKIGGGKAIDPLIKTARGDRDPYIRFETVRLLRVIGVGYTQVLGLALSALNDESRDVRAQAARLLGNFQDDRSIQPLLKSTADTHWSVRQSSEIALLNFGARAVPELIHALSSQKWTTQLRSARLLGEIKDERAIKPLEKCLARKNLHPEVKTVIKDALQKLYGKIAA